MKKFIILLTAGVFLITGAMTAFGGEDAPLKVKNYANSVLVKYGTDPVIVNAVKEENAKKKTIDKINELDQKWMNTIGTDDFMNAMMTSPCSQHLLSIKKTNDFYEEIFVMDNQGANVAMTDKTSDYWQGDEAKFTNCYKSGGGEVYISDVNFDDSTQAYLTQVSVPVMDDGKAIGVILFGINIDKLN